MSEEKQQRQQEDKLLENVRKRMKDFEALSRDSSCLCARSFVGVDEVIVEARSRNIG